MFYCMFYFTCDRSLSELLLDIIYTVAVITQPRLCQYETGPRSDSLAIRKYILTDRCLTVL